jgi:hypothetical protein
MRKEVKDNLKKSLLDFGNDDLPIEDGSILEPEKLVEIVPFNLDEKQKSTTIRARKLVTSMLKLLSDSDVLERSEYLQAKKRLDSMSLYQFLMSIEQTEHIIKILIDTIDSGNTNSRLFEVFGNLQRTKMDLIKEVGMLINNIEESVKKTTLEFKEKLQTIQTNEVVDDNKKPFRGNKDLMRLIKLENGKDEKE